MQRECALDWESGEFLVSIALETPCLWWFWGISTLYVFLFVFVSDTLSLCVCPQPQTMAWNCPFCVPTPRTRSYIKRSGTMRRPSATKYPSRKRGTTCWCWNLLRSILHSLSRRWGVLRPLLDQWHIAAFEQLGTLMPEQRPMNLLRREEKLDPPTLEKLCPLAHWLLPVLDG